MRNLKKQFGARFVLALGKSPTLLADLKEIRKRGIKIRRLRKRDVYYSVHETQTIYIGRGARATQLANLGHEFTHLTKGEPVHSTYSRVTTRGQFVKARLDDEARAEAHAMKITGELLRAKVPAPDQQWHWYIIYKKEGGQKGIRKELSKTTNSVTGEFYPVFYRKMYDDLHERVLALAADFIESSGQSKVTQPS